LSTTAGRVATAEWIGLVGLYAFALFAQLSVAGAYLAMALMLTGMILMPRVTLLPMLRSPLFWTTCAIAAYVVVHAWASAREFPQTAADQWRGMGDYGHLALFLWFPAFWLSGRPDRMRVALALFVAGVLVRTLIYAPWGNMGAFLSGALPPYKPDMWHIPYGLYVAIALAATLLVGAPAVYAMKRGRVRTLLALLLVLVVLILLEAIVLTKSRGVWVMVLVTAPVAAWLAAARLWPRSATGTQPRRRRAVAVGSVLVVLAAAILANLDTIVDRASREQATYAAILSDNVANVPPSSVGERIHLWYDALKHIAERPLVGWGPGSQRMIIQQIPYIRHATESRPGYSPPSHVHDLYLSILMRLGVTGFVLFLLMLVLLLRRGWRAHSSGALDDDLAVFLIASLLAILVWSLTDIRFHHWDFNMVFALLAGAAVALGSPRIWPRATIRGHLAGAGEAAAG